MGRVVGYNVQTAVDTRHHLIVAHKVTNARSDRAQLYPMGSKVQAVLGKTDVTLLANKGYCSGQSIKQVHKAGMTPLVPRTHRTEKQANGLF